MNAVNRPLEVVAVLSPRRVIGLVAAIFVASQLAFATPAFAASSITVTPNTDLVEFQQLTVAGTGFTPNASVEVCEGVVSDTPSQHDCSFSHTFGQSSPSGDFTLTLDAIQSLNSSNFNPPIDCWIETKCVIIAAETVGTIGNGDLAFIPGTVVYSQQLTFVHVQTDARIRSLQTDAIRFDDRYLFQIPKPEQWAVNTTTAPRNFSYAIQIQNDGNITDALIVHGGEDMGCCQIASPEIRVRYFCAWQDVTSQVLSDAGFTFPHMPPGAFGRLSLQFLVSPNAPVDAKSRQAVSVSSGAAHSGFIVGDQVQLGVRVVAP